MLDRLDDPTPFVPDEQFRSGVDRRARKLKFRRRMLTTSLVSVVLIAGLAVGALAYVVRRDAAIERIPITMQPSTDGATNLLVVGSNDLPTKGADHLADEVAILRFEKDGTVRILSIPRDLWDPQQNRPLIADYLDGPQALVDRVTGMLGVPVDHYVGLDFAGFAELVDTAGGLHIGIDQPLRDDATGLDLEPTPCTTLDGATTLALVRSRSIGEPAGDLGRIELDQAIMKIAVGSLADSGTDLLTIDSYTQVLADHAVVDSGLSLTRLMRLGRALVGAGSAGTSAETLPVEETVAPDGGAVLRLNSAAPAVLQSFGATASNPTPPPAPSSPPAAGGPIHSC